MKKLYVGILACVLGFAPKIAYCHEDLHDFKIYLTVRGAPVVMYEVKQVPHKLADVLCDNLTNTVKAWKLAPGTDPLVLDSINGKVTLFEKGVVDSVFCTDTTPQEPIKPKAETKCCQPHWILVRHCDRCSQVYWVYR